ncbi:MAG: zf-HC2 domain-containing protein [Clostridia bacterium]|nr:zf-HC2 domain-containing protein [Clostridia bacterium]
MEKKTECEIVQDLLLGYVDNVLNTESRKLVEKHLLECNECQKKLNDIKQDIKEIEDNQKKEIDYLKKIRRRNKIKSIFIAIGIIFFILLILYTIKFIKINSVYNKAEKSLQTNNYYKETRQMLYEDGVSVLKEYFKDGKYKSVWEIYSDNGIETKYISYATEGSNERYTFADNKVTIEKGENTQILNNSLFNDSSSDNRKKLFIKLGTAFYMSIDTSTFSIGKEYYILKNQFENPQIHETWIDKETGLTIKEINKNCEKIFIAGTDIVKEERDNIQEYKYEFNKVTDEDVTMPDLTKYEVQNVNY